MENSGFDIASEIEEIIERHLQAIKDEAHNRILSLKGVDAVKARQQINSAVDAYGGDMRTDATYGLRHLATEYASQRWLTMDIATSRAKRTQV